MIAAIPVTLWGWRSCPEPCGRPLTRQAGPGSGRVWTAWRGGNSSRLEEPSGLTARSSSTRSARRAVRSPRPSPRGWSRLCDELGFHLAQECFRYNRSFRRRQVGEHAAHLDEGLGRARLVARAVALAGRRQLNRASCGSAGISRTADVDLVHYHRSPTGAGAVRFWASPLQLVLQT
jgi:hypothetical protein